MFNSASAGGLLSALATKAKALAAGVSEVELKVLEATNEDKWGPHGTDMKEIARLAEDSGNRAQIMGIIWQRLQETDANWRLCYKALLLCEFLIKQGPMRCVDELHRSAYIFERLRDNFHYKDPDGRDQGVNVRQRARELAALLSSAQRVQEERDKARQNAGKYKGVSSSDMMRGGGGYGGYGNTGGSGYDSYSSAGGGGGGGGRGGYGNNNDSYGNNNSSRGGDSAPYAHAHTNSGGSGGAPAAASSPRRGKEEDPFEATRRRIEKLRASGTGDDGAPAHVPTGGINMDAPATLFPEAKPRPGPKKLSDVKVSPNITAGLGGGGGLLLAPPRSGTPSAPRSPVAAPAGRTQPPPAPAVDLLDLLGDATPAPSAVPPPVAAAAPGQDAWDAFSAAPPPAAPAGAPPKTAAPRLDDFSDFTAAPPPLPSSRAAAPLDLLGFDDVFASAPAPQRPANNGMGTPAGVPSSAQPPRAQPLASSDPFGSLTTAPTRQAPSPAGFDPFATAAAPAAPRPAAPDDTFTPFVGANPVPAPPAVTSTGGVNAKAPAHPNAHKYTDPFANLL